MKNLTLEEIGRRIETLRFEPRGTIITDEKATAARAALSSRAGRVLTDDEWREAGANLLAFFALLAEYKERGIIKDE